MKKERKTGEENVRADEMRKEKVRSVEAPGRLVQSVERALDIIDALAAGAEGLTLMALSRETELNPSTCHHLLKTLSHRGYVTRDRRTKEYRLGSKLFEFSREYSEQFDLTNLAMPFLQELNGRSGESTHLAVLRADELVTLIKLDSTHAVKVDSGVMGKSDAAHATATGRALLAYLTERDLEGMLAGNGLRPFTEHTVTSLTGLKTILGRVRAKGYSEDVEEFQPGVHCIGAPIRDHNGGVIASVSCATPTMRMTEDNRQRLVELVLGTADSISRELGFQRAGKVAGASKAP